MVVFSPMINREHCAQDLIFLFSLITLDIYKHMHSLLCASAKRLENVNQQFFFFGGGTLLLFGFYGQPRSN